VVGWGPPRKLGLTLIAHQKNEKTSLFLRDQEDRMLFPQRIYHQRGESQYETRHVSFQVRS
jgi:hypothetical protein